MDSIREKGYEILDIVKTIYQLEEERNPSAIIGNKIFSILADGRVLVECNNDKTDHCYYFETPEMEDRKSVV